MNKKLIKSISILILGLKFFFSSILPSSGTSDYSAKLLTYDFLPSMVALGGAGSTYLYEGNAFLYNPAILTYQNNEKSLTYSHSSLVENTDIDFFSLLMSDSFLALTWLNSKIGDYSKDNFYRGELNSSDFLLNYGKSFDLDSFSLGVDLKYLYTTISSFSSHILAVDLGFMIPVYSKLLLSLSVNNLGVNLLSLKDGVLLNLDNNYTDVEGSSLPMLVRFGLKFNILKELNFYSDLDYYINKKVNTKLGLEYNFQDTISLKVGYYIPESGYNTYSFGFSYFIKDMGIVPFKLQYALKNTAELGNSHHFSIIFY